MLSVEEGNCSPSEEEYLFTPNEKFPLDYPFFHLSISHTDGRRVTDETARLTMETFVPGGQFTEFTNVFTDEIREKARNIAREKVGHVALIIKPKVRHFGFEIKR